jgi:hypothetical protein
MSTRSRAPSRTGNAVSRTRVATPLESLHNAAGNRSVQRLLASAILRQPDKAGDKPPKKGDVKKDEPKTAAWSRKHTRGPRLLDGSQASYQVFFDHLLPAVPKGKKQLWQVVENVHEVLTKDCKVETKRGFVIDVVNIGDRTAIGDSWGWIPAEEPCFAREFSNATVGFDDGKSNYAEDTNVNATNSLAKDTLRKMKGPKGTYGGTYTFVNKVLCTKCAKKLEEIQKKHGAPDGEALKIAGVGEWTDK